MRMILSVAATALVLSSVWTAASAQKQSSNLSITLPSAPWTYEFDVKDFAVKVNEIQPDGRAYLDAENTKTNVILSVFLEHVGSPATAEGCVDNQKKRMDQKSPFKRDKVVSRIVDAMNIVEYTIPEYQGAPIQQRNIFVCIPKDDVYVDVHLSKILFKPQDQALFDAVLSAAHFVPKSAPATQ
jgi:hypothetical protein